MPRKVQVFLAKKRIQLLPIPLSYPCQLVPLPQTEEVTGLSVDEFIKTLTKDEFARASQK
jgi:hypothetical protein